MRRFTFNGRKKYLDVIPDGNIVDPVPFFAYRIRVNPVGFKTYYLGPWDNVGLAEIYIQTEADLLEKRGVAASLLIERSSGWDPVG